MSSCRAKRAYLALGLVFGVIGSTAPRPAYSGVLDLLPSWPVTNVGDPIPDNLINEWMGLGKKTAARMVRMGHRCPAIPGFHAFPSKGPINKDDQIKGKEYDEPDPDTLCDDGDQTTYNGMLCASGIEAGCIAVAEAQDMTGRFFRSPHRRGMWRTRCTDTKLSENIYNNRCAYGFSPDMNLGVLLYVLKKRDIRRYEHWLSWLDETAPTTKLCKIDGDRIYDCDNVEWPRVCPEDMGYGQGAGEVAIFGKYGGKCALRPWDALDFAAVSDALAVSPPSRMSNWDVKARLVMRGVKEVSDSIVPMTRGVDGPPIVFMSLFDPTHFPLHLDAVRVLIRMMIKNPSLHLDNLPQLPDIDDALPGILDASMSNGTDPVSVNLAAKIIWRRYPGNPFYHLLAEGPKPEVRASILERCPAIGDTPDNGHWIWEKQPGEEYGKKEHSMGWDCAFVGKLYNKMRVKKSLVDELLDQFLKYADPVDTSLKHANQVLQLAGAANELEQKALDEAEHGLKSASDFVSGGYTQLRNAQLGAINSLTNQLNDLADRETSLEHQASDFRNQAATLPDQILEDFVDKVCDWAGIDWLCKYVKKAHTIPNAAKKRLLDQIATIENELTDLRDNARVVANQKIKEANQAIADLDSRFQALQKKFADQSLEAAVSVARKSLDLKGKALVEARKAVAELRRVDARVRGSLAVWKNDDSSIEAMSEPGKIEEPKEPTVPPGSVGRPPVTHAEASRDSSTQAGNSRAAYADYFFSIVGSFHTKAATLRQASFLRTRANGSKIETFLPFRRSPYWVVTNTSYATFHVAREAAIQARRTGIQRDAFVLRMRQASQ